MKEFLLHPMPLTKFKDVIKECLEEVMKATSEQEKSNDDSEHYLTAEEAAKFLKVSLVSIHNWKREKGLSFYRIGRSIRFKKADLIEFAEKKRKRRA